MKAGAVLRQFSFAGCVLCLLAGLAQAQEPRPAATPKPESRPATSQTPKPPNQVPQNQGPTFRVNVRLVNVFTTVTDAQGTPIANLAKDDFRVLEDGIPQNVSVFDRESELPLSIVLAIDTSQSTLREFKLEVTSARKFVRSIMRPVDHLAVFQVTENIDQITPFTSDVQRILHGIDHLQVGAGTSLYDAIFLASDALMDREGRKVLVLITDGGDTTSHADYNRALKRAQQAEAIVYSIIVVPVEADAGRNTGGEHALIQISHDTGGKHYYADSMAELDDAFRQVSDELRTQYLLAYYPSRQVADSPFRRIEVQMNKKPGDAKTYKVRHRAGYYTAPAR